MNASQFSARLTAHFGQPVAFNSNNGWGFGGGFGHRWSDGKVVVKMFAACYRHLKPEQALTITVSGVRVFDELQSPRSFKHAVAALELLPEVRA